MTRYDPVKDCLQDGPRSSSYTETQPEPSRGRLREDVASKLFDDKRRRATVGASSFESVSGLVFQSRHATDRLFSRPAQSDQFYSLHHSTSSPNLHMISAPSSPQNYYFPTDRNRRIVKTTTSTEMMHRRHSSRERKIESYPSHPYARHNSRSSSRASTTHSYDMSEEDDSDACSSVSEYSQHRPVYSRPADIAVPGPDIEVASPSTSSIYSAPTLSSSASSPSQSELGYELPAGFSRQYYRASPSEPHGASFSFPPHSFSLPSPYMPMRGMDEPNTGGADDTGRSRPRNTKPDPADKFLAESVVDGVRIYRCMWSKSGGVPCGHKASRSNARQHVKSRHLKLRPYVCQECGRTWRDQGARYNHRVREHGYVPKKPKKWDTEVEVRSSNDPGQPWSVAFVMDPNSSCNSDVMIVRG